jgi:hypothetical protein
MNKKTSLVLIIVVILVVAIGIWAAVRNNNDDSQATGTTTSMETSSTSQNTDGSTQTGTIGSSCDKKLAAYDFSVPSVYVGKLASVKYDQNNRTTQYDSETKTTAYTYRTAINTAVQNGVNYAGHYVVATWGLGTGYQGSAVIDAITGNIVTYGLKSNEGLSYTSTSTLLVVNPPKNFMEINRVDRLSYASRFTRDFYMLKNDKLSLLCSESATVGL